MNAGNVHLPNERATYVATLYGKALDAATEHPILGDWWAAQALPRIDCDFRQFKLPRGAAVTLAMRGLHFDNWTRAFLAEHPHATVLHLGCGLDTRVYRVDPSPDVRWFDVDFPEVIELREQLYPDRPGYQRVAASVTDLGWLDTIPADRPVFAVGEGLVVYLPPEDGIALLRRITELFPAGQLAFDIYRRATLPLFQRMATLRYADVHLRWGIDDPHELERDIPALTLVECVPFLAMPELAGHLDKGPVSTTINGLLRRFPPYRDLVRHVRYRFG